MVMTDSEIRFKYERADNKNEIVQVLADLNACSKAQMREHLQNMGLIRRQGSVIGISDEIAMNLYSSGMTDRAMADELNVPLTRIAQWRRLHDLGPNKAPKKAPDGRTMLLKDVAPVLATLAERYPDGQLQVRGKPLMSLHLQADMDAMGFVRKAVVVFETEEVHE